MKKKLIATLLTSVMVLSLASCGSKETGTLKPNNSDTRKIETAESQPLESTEDTSAGNFSFEDIESAIDNELNTDDSIQQEETGSVIVDSFDDLKIIVAGQEVVFGKTTLKEFMKNGEKYGGYSFDFYKIDENGNYGDEIKLKLEDLSNTTVLPSQNKLFKTIRFVDKDKESPKFRLEFRRPAEENVTLDKYVVSDYSEIYVCVNENGYEEGDGVLGHCLEKETYQDIVNTFGTPRYDNYTGLSYEVTYKICLSDDLSDDKGEICFEFVSGDIDSLPKEEVPLYGVSVKIENY